MSDSHFRPRMSEYKSEAQIKKEATRRVTLERHQAEVTKVERGKKIYDILHRGLPLLEKYIEKSPIEVRRSSIFSGKTKSPRLVGGWPISEVGVSWRESYSRDSGSRLDYFVVTDENTYGIAEADVNRGVFMLGSPLKISLNNFIEFSPIATKVDSKVIASSPEAILNGVQHFLSEAQIRFE